MIENLEARLQEMSGAWADAPADSIFSPPPDNDYQALIHEFRFVEQKDPPHAAFLVVAFQVDNDADYSGRIVDTMFSLEDPERVKWLKSFFARLGVDVEHMAITQVMPGSPLLEGLLDTPVLIRVKTADKTHKDGSRMVNVYLQERLGSPGAAPPVSDVTSPDQLAAFAPQQTGPADDDIPFAWLMPPLDLTEVKSHPGRW